MQHGGSVDIGTDSSPFNEIHARLARVADLKVVTSVKSPLVPDTNGTRALGSSVKPWGDLYASGTIGLSGTTTLSGATTYTGTTSGNNNIQTLASVEDLLTGNFAPSTWDFFNQNSFGTATGLTGNGTVIYFRKNPLTEMVDMNFKLRMSTGGPGFTNNMLIGTLPSNLLPYEQRYPLLLISNTGLTFCYLEIDGINGRMNIRQLDTSGEPDGVFILTGEASYFSGTITSGNQVPGGQ